jgi:PKHD-type hydroxylase
VQVYILENFLSAAACDALIAGSTSLQPGAVNAKDVVYVRSVRQSHVRFIDEASVCARMRDLVFDINGRVFHFDVSRVEPPQLAEYGVGDKYDEHLDIGPGTAALRKLSLSVQLSDPKDYDGGNLELWGASGWTVAARSRGAVIAFPSYMLHRVTPVTRGARHSLVAWAAGDHAFR